MYMRSSASYNKSLLSLDSAPSPGHSRLLRQRCSFFFCFVAVSVLLFILVGFPGLVEQLRCRIGLTSNCRRQIALQQAVRYNRVAIRKSCAPTHADGKVVLVTGSAGFIGFWASLRLRERGDGVIGIDNFNDYYPVSLKHARAAELASVGVHTVHGDINDMSILAQIFEVRSAP